MGRAINVDNKLDAIEHRLKLVEDALEEMIQTRVHHVDLENLRANPDLKAEGVTVKPTETFTKPTKTTRARKRTKKAEVATT